MIGMRGDCDFMLWQVSENLDDFQEAASDVASSALGAYLETPYSYLSMTKHSMYVSEHVHSDQEGTRLTIAPGGSRYLFVYPFVKTRPWYALSQSERQRIMSAHIATGHKYPTVKLNTTYSFGLDDQEFVLAFETDFPGDFLDLVQELRETESSAYTLRDTPIFTCVSAPIRTILESLRKESMERSLV
jgi:chlorite dismutase